jgi:transposase
LTSKIRVLVDGLGNLIDFRLLPGQRHDSGGVMALLEGLSFVSFLGDKAFDDDKLRAELHERGAKAVIPPRHNRKGRCQLDGGRSAIGSAHRFISCHRRNPGHLPPCAEGGIASLAVFGGGQAVMAKLKVVVDPAVGRQKTLRVTG